MGFSQSTYNVKKLFNKLRETGLLKTEHDEEILKTALKDSLVGGFARIWEIKIKEEKYTDVKITTSRHDNEEESGYKTDFVKNYIRLIGEAKKKIDKIDIPKGGIKIQISSCEATTNYVGTTNKEYTNFTVYDFDIPEDDSESKKSRTSAKAAAPEKEQDITSSANDDDCPF